MNKSLGIVTLLLLLAALPANASVTEGSLLDGVKPGADGKIDVVTIMAHQDDETIFDGGTLLKLKKDPRVRLHIACLTVAEKTEAAFFLRIDHERMAQIRMAEIQGAAAVYGAEEVIQLHYPDQELNQADPVVLAREVREIIEKTGAEIVITHDPAGVTRNPDHIMCSKIVTQVFPQTAAQRLYYTTLPLPLYLTPYLLTPFTAHIAPSRPTLRVDIRDELRLKRLAIWEHASQRHYTFVSVFMVQAEFLPYEWFVLAAQK